MSTAEAASAPQAQSSNDAPRRPRNRRRPQRGGNQGNQEQTNDEQTPRQQPSRGRGGGRGARAGRGQTPRDTTPAAGPSAPQEAVSEPTPAVDGGNGNNSSRRGRRGGRGGGSGRGGSTRQNVRTFQGRQFGGQLTTTGSGAEALLADPSSLQGDAPEFVPGQAAPAKPPKERQPPRKRRASRSTAPDIATRIHEDIDNGLYECAICTNEIQRNSKSWSCRTCWTVFHLGCIKKWSTNEGSAAARQQAQGGDLPPPRQWRCPGCNLPQDVLPKTFTCWCEKEVDPRSLPGLPPFSCGNTCSRERVMPKKCPHRCPDICHAGPCPPCTQMGPTQMCFCGKESKTRKCSETDYDNGWICGQVCGELMPCGEHFCEQPCHEGLCGACEVRVDARCYCGQVEKKILCCDRNDEKDSRRIHKTESGEEVMEEWTALFECGNICHRSFDCGKHQCEQNCHPQDAKPAHCPRSPDVVSHCPCGKTKLSEITTKVRTTCEDRIPNCDKPCSKPLGCGHPCQQICHSGDCFPCTRTMPITCRCGRTSLSTICHQGIEEKPQCMRNCRVTLNCGRHECGERCCPGEAKAAQRAANRRKPRPLDSAPRPVEDTFEAEHICTRPCGRPLKCGNHRCQELCHKGPCGSCREAIFDEISCDCGRTVLQPPLPCGTKPPPCRFQCERPKACGHPQVGHNCHQDDEECPKCPFLTVKPCMCGKNVLKNQPCWLVDARCGEICGKKLKCGAHRCRKPCHKPGECEDVGAACKQACGKEKTCCSHPCTNQCHSPYACDESKPCQYKILITCPCQHNKQETKCLATKDSEGNMKKTLKCDDECARLERNRKLALALNVDPEAHKDDHIPYSAETLSLYQQNVQWAQTQEREFRVFATSPEERRLRFKPMPPQQRAFLHALAEDFGLDSESMDPEPHRHVVIYKTPRFVAAPTKTVGECVRIRYNQRVANTSVAAAATTETSKKLKASNVVGDPYNGFLLTNPRFALTIEELRAAIRPVTDAAPAVQFEISFLPSDEVVLKAATASAAPLAERELETMLKNIKAGLAREVRAHALGSIQLCRLDASLNTLRRESDTTSSGGWSQVAAKAAAPNRPRAQQAANTPTNSFTVLSLSSKTRESREKKEKTKKKVALEEAVDDWETAEAMEEEKERLESGEASKVASGVVSEDEGEVVVQRDGGGQAAVTAGAEAEVERDESGDVEGRAGRAATSEAGVSE